MNFNVILLAFETTLKGFMWICNSLNLKLCGLSYGILNRAQLSGMKQSSLGATEFCKNNNLGYS